MAFQRTTKVSHTADPASSKSTLEQRLQAPGGRLCLFFSFTPLLLLGMFFMSFGFLFLGFQLKNFKTLGDDIQERCSYEEDERRRYLYWGPGIDCPGKHCVDCGGLGHQESSLRCALEEALFLNRTFVMPSRMCIANKHSDVSPWQKATRVNRPGDLGTENFPMESLYDLDLMSHSVPVLLSNSKEWQAALQREKEHVHVKSITRDELKHGSIYCHALVINRTTNKLAWFVECKNRHNRSSVLLPYSFLPSKAAHQLRTAAEQIKEHLGDYDALHVRRGDKVKVHKDRFGVLRSMYVHLDHDTQPEAILKRIKTWIPEGRILFIATDEQQPHYFDNLSLKLEERHHFVWEGCIMDTFILDPPWSPLVWYRLMKAENFSMLLNRVVQNNYQLFMIERLVLLGARTLVKTWKEEAGDLSLSDEAKKGSHTWKPVLVT